MKVSPMKSKIDIMSLEQAQQLLTGNFPKNTAVVSFFDPPDEHNGFCGETPDYRAFCTRVFSVGIYDIDIDSLEEYGLTYETYFLEAKELAAFIVKAIDEGCDIICQCMYGQSRSAACAAAILQYYEGRGIDIFADYRYSPNQLVYHKIMDALENQRGINPI